jgi:hypothetical protein
VRAAVVEGSVVFQRAWKFPEVVDATVSECGVRLWAWA